MDNKRIALAFLYCARTDIRDALILFRNNQYNEYPSVVYHFQQAIEKATKAVGLFFGAINYKKASKISHKDYKVWNKVISKIVGQAKEKGHADFECFEPLNFNEWVNELKGLNSDNERLASIIKEIDRWSENPEIIPGDDTFNIELATTNILLLLSVFLGAIEGLNMFTRYPTPEGILPHQTYNENYIIIQNFERLAYIVEKGIENLIELYGVVYPDLAQENR